MSASTRTLTFEGPMTKRGFWLYVWRIQYCDREFLYVGRTGDSSSANASSPFARMGQHLGKNEKENMMRRHLKERGVEPEECSTFTMVARGPLYLEVEHKDKDEKKRKHDERRDKVAALEKALAESLICGGYDVLNTVNSKKCLDRDLWNKVCEAFACHFCRICRAEEHYISQKDCIRADHEGKD